MTKRSISDDDLCASCARCDYNPGGESGCQVGWPATLDPDGYATDCDKFVVEASDDD